jgi:hypothetical protein
VSRLLPQHPAFEAARHFLGSPRFSAALTLTIIGSELASLLLR